MTVRSLCNLTGADYKLTRERILKYGWDVERAVTTPKQEKAMNMNVRDLLGTSTRQAELQVAADQQLADARDQAGDEGKAGLPAGALGADAMADLIITDDLTDDEIVTLVAEAFSLSTLAAVERLAVIDFDAARELAGA